MSGQQCVDVCYGVYSEMMTRTVGGGGGGSNMCPLHDSFDCICVSFIPCVSFL